MVDKVKPGFVPVRPSRRVQRRFDLPTRTRASETARTDLKTLVRQYQRIGALPPSTLSYGDATAYPESRLEAFNLIKDAIDAFQDLPLKVRQAVGHDPRMLSTWIAANPQLAAEYGLMAQAAPKSSSPESRASSADAGEGKSGTDA